MSLSLSTVANLLPIKNAESRMWSIGILCLAAVVFPYVVVGTLVIAAYYRLVTAKPQPAAGPMRTAIITGGKMSKALATARILKKAGCRVVMGARTARTTNDPCAVGPAPCPPQRARWWLW